MFRLKYCARWFSFWCIGAGLLMLLWWSLGRAVVIDAPELPAGRALECVSYTPYEKDQSPWDFAGAATARRERLDTDLQMIAKISGCIRIYSVHGIGDLLAVARQYRLQVLLGGWVNADPVNTRAELQELVRVAKQYPDIVRAVIVGNETLLRKEVTSAQLIAHLQWVRAQLPGVPLTYADVWEFWLEYPELVPYFDFVTMHVLPYWENTPAAAGHAIEHLEKVLAKVRPAFPGKPLFIGEIGWPSEGRMRNLAWPSRTQQAQYLRTVVDYLSTQNIPYNIIEAFDQPWKRNSEGTVGGHWGVFDADRHGKNILAAAVSDIPDWQAWAGRSVAAWTGLLLLGLFGASSIGATAIRCCASFLLIWQLREYSFAVRWWPEAVWAGVVLGAALMSASTLFSGDEKNRWRQRVAIGGASLAVLIVAATSLDMLVDARYRSFPNAGASVVMAVWWWNARREKIALPIGGAMWALLLIGCAIGILWQETVWNLQALWWVGLCALGSVLLLRDVSRAAVKKTLRACRPALAVMLATYGLAALVRYGLMQSTGMVARCSLDPLDRWCQLREMTGLLIHYRYFGKMALGCGVAAFLLRRWNTTAARMFTLFALITAVWGVTLYTVDYAGWGLLLAWGLLALHRQKQM